MAKYVPKDFDQLLQQMINKMVARTSLSDITPTSVAKHMLAATARVGDQLYFQISNKLDAFSIDRSSGDDLDRRALDYNPAVISRRLSLAASGSLVFSRTTPNPGAPITIPIGTLVEVPGANPRIIVATTAVGTIATSGTSTGNVAAVAIDGGARGNAGESQLTKFSGPKPSGVDSVSNPVAFAGGIDVETDDSLRQRLKDYASSLARGTPHALETAALETELPSTGQRVVYAKAVEDLAQCGLVTLYIDDGTGTVESTAVVATENLTFGAEFPGDVAQGGETVLYTDNRPLKDGVVPVFTRDPGATVLIRDDPGADGYTLNPAAGQLVLNTPLTAGDDVDGAYTHFTGLIQETQKVIDGDAGDRTNYPGWRAGGVLVKVLPPTVVLFTADVGIAVRNGFSLSLVASNVRAAITGYVNSLGIGNDVILSELIERAMAVDGMFDILVNDPTANISILEDQLVRVNNAAQDIVVN